MKEIEDRLKDAHDRHMTEGSHNPYKSDVEYLLHEVNTRLELLAELMLEQMSHQKAIIAAIEWDQ